MPKFKDKVIRKYDGGFNQPGAKGADPYSKPEEVPQFIKDLFTPGQQITKALGDSGQSSMPLGIGAEYDPQAAVKLLQQKMDKENKTAQNNSPSLIAKPVSAVAPTKPSKPPIPSKKNPVAPVANVSPADISKSVTNSNSEFLQGMDNSPADLTNAMSAYGKPTTPTIPDIVKSITQSTKSSAAPDMAKAAGELPKTKSGMKKFMDEYGKFIALGALSGFGGKGGAIAAPIMAALPGILKMLQNRGKKTPGAPSGTPVVPPVDTLNVAHGGLLGNKSAAHPKKKMAGGAIRKFSGGVMKKVTKKFAEGGESKSDKRESAFNRLTPQYGAGFAALGTATPLRKDSISEKLLKEEDTRYRPFSDSKEETNDKDMKSVLA